MMPVSWSFFGKKSFTSFFSFCVISGFTRFRIRFWIQFWIRFQIWFRILFRQIRFRRIRFRLIQFQIRFQIRFQFWKLISLSLVWSDRKKKILSKCHSPWGCQIKAPDLERREAEVVIAAGESNFEDIWDTNNSICRKLYYLLLARTKSWSSLNHVSHHLPIHRCIMFGQYLPSMALAKLSCAVYSPDKIVTAAMIYWHEHDITATQH